MVDGKLINIVSISIAGMSFKLKLHHDGFFQRDPAMQYVGTSDSGSVIDIDVDKWSFFEAIEILKEDFGYGDQLMRLWWKGGYGEYKEITMGSHALELSNYIITNNCEVELFVECVGGNEGVVDDNFSSDSEDRSDESMKDVQLYDSEEERTIGLDDGFDLTIPKIGGMKNKQIKRLALKNVCNLKG